MSDTRTVRLADIKIGNRYRKDIGDLASLAASIAKKLLHPPVVDTEMNLVCGFRRLRAAELNGWSTIPVRVIDIEDLIEMEHDENELRKDFTISERVAIGAAIEAKSGERRGNPSIRRNSDELEKGKRTDEVAAEKAGFGSKDSYRDAKAVVDKGAPELVAAVDAGAVSVNAAAEVAKLPKPEQKKVVAKGPEAVKKAAKASRQAKQKSKPEPVNQPAAAESASDTPVHTPPDRLTMLCPTCCGTGRVPKKQPVQPLYTATGMPEIPAALDTPDFILAWESWLHERKRRKQTVTPNAARLQLRDLDAHGVKVAIETIETSIKNGWTGLFPGKAGTNGQHAHGRNGRVQAGVRVVGAPGDFDDCAPALS